MQFPPAFPHAAPVLVVGDSMLDRYWDGVVERISPEAPVPVLRFTAERQRAGGAANVAANLAALGCHAVLATLLGEDISGEQLAGLMRAQGVRLQALQRADVLTTQKIRAVSRQHQLLRMDFERPAPAEAAAALCELACSLVPRYPWVLASDYGKGALAHCDRLIAHAREHGSRVLADPKGRCFQRYRGAWLLKPNEAEAAAVAGPWSDEAGFHRAMAALREELGLTHLLVTRGERGMALFSEDREQALVVPAQAREVFDVSGAGDTVLAALACALACGAPLDDAVRLANRAAGVAVGKAGTAVVTREELLDDQGPKGARDALAER